MISLNFAPPTNPLPKGEGEKGGCCRTLAPPSCRALFGYLLGDRAFAPYLRRRQKRIAVRRTGGIPLTEYLVSGDSPPILFIAESEAALAAALW